MIWPSSSTSTTPIARKVKYAFVLMPGRSLRSGTTLKEIPSWSRWETRPSPGERVGVRAGAAAFVQFRDRGHVLGLEFEAENVQVLPHPVPLHRLREHDVAQLQLPAQDD